MTLRDSLRNIAIIAHVDHGKTTLVDAMLRQTGSFATHGDAVDRVMDSGDLEREKGITILAKNTAVNWNGTTINIIDTPGHADFGGEVERGLAMVDGVILLVDAAEGPLPQTRFVLRKTLARRLPVILLINKVDRPDAWEVQGRGELQLAILIETMRREGFELTIGKPRVVTKEIDGVLNEPFERVTVDIPEEFVGNVTALLSQRRGSMLDMVNHGTGWVRLEWRIPARGLVGVRTEFMTETRGTGILNSVFDGYSPWVGEIRHRLKGTMVADRSGVTTPYCLIDLEARGILFVDAGIDVYEGMIIGENSRADEMNVNPTKEKKLTNMRASGSDNTERMSPPTVLSLEQALEFIADDEAVEVTPKTIRLRKVVLDANTRARLIKSEKNRNA